MAFVSSLLIAEMVFGDLQSLYSVRFLYPILLLGLIGNKVRLMNIPLYIICVLYFVLPALFALHIPFINADIVNIIWWVSFMFILNDFLRTTKDFNLYYKSLLTCTFVLTFMGSLIGLYKLYMLSNGVVFESMQKIGEHGYLSIVSGSSLNADYNIYSFGVYFGVTAGWNIYLSQKKSFYKIIISLALVLMFVSSMLSSSRRGLVIGIMLIVIFSVVKFRKDQHKYKLDKIKQNTIPWFFVIIFSTILIVINKIDIDILILESNDIANVFNRLETTAELGSDDYDTRSPRWQFALSYFIKQPFFNQIFGSGFEYTELTGEAFKETTYDYPHNVYISAILYSGLLGFFFLVALTLYTSYKYYLYKEYMGMVSIWFIMLLILVFSSNNSIFSGRFSILLFLFPYLNVLKVVKNSNTGGDYRTENITSLKSFKN